MSHPIHSAVPSRRQQTLVRLISIARTLGKSTFSSSIISPQHSSFSSPTNFTSFPWLKLSRIAAFTSPAVLIRCPGDSNSEIPDGAFGADSNASNAIVRSSSARNSGDSSPRGANSSCANCNASAIRPCRISSINFCCCNLKYNPGFVSRIYNTTLVIRSTKHPGQDTVHIED